MSSKKKSPTSSATNPPALTIGSRVHCTDDGVEGRIVWANAVSVKIRWDDGEQVTWRRDTLASRPVAILAEGGENQTSSAATTSLSRQTDTNQPPPVAPTSDQRCSSAEQAAAGPSSWPTAMEPAPADRSAEAASAAAIEVPESVVLQHTPAENLHTEDVPSAQTIQQSPTPPEQAASQTEAPSTAAKQPRTRKPKAAEDSTGGRQSALDAAAKILSETGIAMTCPEMIEQMAAKGYWTSPAGKTPQATLYAAIHRDIATKGSSSRFVKTQRGTFALGIRE
jgi:hypothetical protein